jgi:hypothetical protein
MAVVYAKRQTLFRDEKTEYVVEEDALIIREPGKAELRIPWRNVDSVRLAYAPTRFKTWRHVFVLYLKRGRKIEIDNVHFNAVADFSDYSETYVPFVHAALARIKLEAPGVTARAGSAIVSYILNILIVVAGFSLLAFALITIPTPLDYMPFGAFVKLAIIIFFLPVLIRWGSGHVRAVCA